MKLESNTLTCQIVNKGGEMSSLYDKTLEKELLWQADPAFWGGQNPTLFPIVGSTYSKSYQWKGQTYSMKNHGLIRYATLNCIKEDDKQIVMQLKSNEETKAQYPFDFTYEIGYELQDNKVVITYNITNDSEEPMPFIFGLHPAFNVPLFEDESFEDYHIVFPQVENVKQTDLDTAELYEVELSNFALSYEEILKAKTLIYQDLKSPYVDLVGKHHTIRVSIVGYKYLAFWTPKEHAPFICIEPWYGTGDYKELNVSFDKRPNTINLDPNRTFMTSYTIEVLHHES